MSFSAKHPKGLYLLFATEMWERFSYYGMRAIFILYMTQALLFNKELASEIYGSYTGLVYLTPLIGGYIADRYWGNRKSIVFGAVIMALGQFFMFLSACFHHQTGLAVPLMFLGLFTLIMGNGFFKPNISTMVGDLYEPADHRKDSAFTIFYMGVNVGSFIAPLWCGFVGDTGNPEDFKWGFLSACVGMILGTVLFCAFKNKYIVTPEGAPIGTVPAAKANAQQATASAQQTGTGTQQVATAPAKSGSSRKTVLGILSAIVLFLLFSVNWNYLHDWSRIFEGADLIGTAIYAISVVVPVIIITDKSLTRIEQARIGVIYIIAFFVIFFWSAYEQAGASLTFFADEQTDRHLGSWEMPASYFQSFNPVMLVCLTPIFTALWGALDKRGLEPSSPVKQAIGLLLLAVGYVVIAFGVKDLDPNVKVSMLWLTSLYMLHTMGEICLSPIGLSMVNKLSPARFSSLMMGVWYMSTAAANKFAGMLSSYYPEEGVDKHLLGYHVADLFDFFMLFAIMSAVAAVILFCLTGILKKMMHGVE